MSTDSVSSKLSIISCWNYFPCAILNICVDIPLAGRRKAFRPMSLALCSRFASFSVILGVILLLS